jgi:hypothetical protein
MQLNIGSSIAAATAGLTLVSCGGVPPEVFPNLVCGFARVVVKETDIPLFETNFGTDAGAGQRVCNAIAALLTDGGSGESEPIVIRENTVQPITLPDGSEVVVTLQPPA